MKCIVCKESSSRRRVIKTLSIEGKKIPGAIIKVRECGNCGSFETLETVTIPPGMISESERRKAHEM